MNGNTEKKWTLRAGCMGISCNLLLFALKFFLGHLSRSVSIQADATNNLSDALTSALSLFAALYARKEADEEHPFGHGRMEYIMTMILSMLILQVGMQMLRESIGKLLCGGDPSYPGFAVWILLFSIGLKVLMGLFYRLVAEKSRSEIYRASMTDSFQDVFVTAATLLGLFLSLFCRLNLDGILGILVSLVVLRNGIGIFREMLEPLLGQQMDPGLYYTIRSYVDSMEGVLGSHDLMLHSYGRDRCMGSIHVEVDGSSTLRELHPLLDRIEEEIFNHLHVEMVVHPDPVENGPEIQRVKAYLKQLVQEEKKLLTERGRFEWLSFHDLHHELSGTGQETLHFDLCVPWRLHGAEEERMKERIQNRLQQRFPSLRFLIHTEHPYLSFSSEEAVRSARKQGLRRAWEMEGRCGTEAGKAGEKGKKEI